MTTRELAAQYIRDQLDIIRKHGGKPRLNAEQRREAIASTQRTFETMRERCDQPQAHAARSKSRTLQT